jgi:hypothetical protein
MSNDTPFTASTHLPAEWNSTERLRTSTSGVVMVRAMGLVRGLVRAALT